MVAERLQLSHLPQAQHQTLLAVFAQEAKADALVQRLIAMDIEPENISVIRIALGAIPIQANSAAPPIPIVSSRASTIGIIVGGVIALLLGLILYATNFLQLSFLEAFFVHTLALVLLGGVIGGAVGAIWASAQAQKQAITLLPQSADGVMVVVRTPLHLLAQCEALARELGAKKFFS